MTISLGNLGTAASGTTPVVVSYPTVDASSIALLFVTNKPFGTTTTVDNADWVQVNNEVSGAVADGASVGSVRGTVWWQEGNVNGGASDSVANGGATPTTMGRIVEFDKTAANWCTPIGVGLVDSTETGTTVSATTAVHLACEAGDMLVLHVTIKDDAPNHTSQSLSIPGCTLGSITWQTKSTTTSNNDAGEYIGTCTVSSGSSTGVATYTATSSVSGASSTAVNLIRLREAVANPLTDSTMSTLHLVRSTDQSIGNNSRTAISWSSEVNNTTQAAWWASGAPTQIVLPWTGLYYVNFNCCWESNATGIRTAYLNNTTTINDANRIAGTANPTVSSGEDSAYDNFGAMISATAGDIWVMTVFQDSGGSLNLDDGRFGIVPAAQLTITYLEG